MKIARLILFCFSLAPHLLAAQSYDAELLSYETNTLLDKGKLIRTTSVQVQINTRAGEKYASVSIPYSESDKISKISAFIEDRQGRVIRKLKKGDISERSDISQMSLYEDDFVKEFTLKHNSYPYTITYSYQVQQDEFIYLDYWIPVLSRKIPTRKASLTISVPLDLEIAYLSNLVDDFQTDTTEGLVRYCWEADYRQTIKNEDLSPPLSDFLPSVKVVLLDFSYELEGSFRSWTDYGIWESTLLEDMQDLPEKEKRKIASMIEGMDDEREKIRVLYHYLQDETRYVNVSIETGGMKPYPASYVAENKYGDCKALSNYFMAVLQAAGIRSYYTNVYAGEPIRTINRNFPSQQFNHVILFIPLPQDTIWLDCTSDGAFDFLGTFTQNREALLIDDEDSRFIQTPALSSEEVLESRRIHVPYDRYGEIAVTFHNSFRGEMYELLAELDDGYNLNDKARILRNYLMEDGFEMVDYSMEKPHRDSASIYLSYTANTDQLFEHYGKDILVKNIPVQLPKLEEPGDRTLPVQLDYPIHHVDTITYDLPSGYALFRPIESKIVSGKPGSYSLEFSEQENSIQVVKKLEIQPGYYSLEEYKAFYEFINEIYLIENKTFITLSKQ